MSEESLPLEFRTRLEAARRAVDDARAKADKVGQVHALKHLGSIERRPPFMWETAVRTFEEALELCRELDMPLDEAWVLRHLGIVHEYREHLELAEEYYDESLTVFRKNAAANSLDYANTVRYPAVIKNRVGKRDESTILWEEACRRYDEIGVNAGVAEAAAHLTNFALDQGDLTRAREWFDRADRASSATDDPETHKFIAEVKARLDAAV